MAERFSVHAPAVASGTNKTLTNIFNPAATPTCRGKIYDLLVSSPATPADASATFYLNRSTGVGTEGTGFTPNNLDPAGPAGAYDSGYAHSAEPTYTANKMLLNFALNLRATFRWVAAPGSEILMAATQNNGAGLYTPSSSGTHTHNATVLFEE